MKFDTRDSIFFNTVFNVNHATDINYCMRYTKWFLRFLGIWPFVNTRSSEMEKKLGKMILSLSSISMIILVIPPLSYLMIQKPDRSELIILLAPVTFQLTNVINHFFMILRRNSMKVCIQHVETDWRRVDDSIDREIMMRNVRKGHNLTIACTLFMYGNLLSYHVALPFLTGNIVTDLNETIKPLTFPGNDNFFDPQRPIVYEIVFGSNVLSAFFHWTLKLTVCLLGVKMVGHACGQIQVVVRQIENLVHRYDDDDENFLVDRIGVIIRNHVRLISFSQLVDKILAEIFLMEVFASTLIICLVEYCCIMEWANSDRVALLTYFVLTVTFVLNLLLFCQLGEVLKDQFQEIGDAVYTIEWYRLPKKNTRALFMILFMGNCPRKLTAGRMMELSIASFAKTLKTSFAYLNMLRTMA